MRGQKLVIPRFEERLELLLLYLAASWLWEEISNSLRDRE
jgi:hypothetical protein